MALAILPLSPSKNANSSLASTALPSQTRAPDVSPAPSKGVETSIPTNGGLTRYTNLKFSKLSKQTKESRVLDDNHVPVAICNENTLSIPSSDTQTKSLQHTLSPANSQTKNSFTVTVPTTTDSIYAHVSPQIDFKEDASAVSQHCVSLGLNQAQGNLPKSENHATGGSDLKRSRQIRKDNPRTSPAHMHPRVFRPFKPGYDRRTFCRADHVPAPLIELSEETIADIFHHLKATGVVAQELRDLVSFANSSSFVKSNAGILTVLGRQNFRWPLEQVMESRHPGIPRACMERIYRSISHPGSLLLARFAAEFHLRSLLCNAEGSGHRLLYVFHGIAFLRHCNVQPAPLVSYAFSLIIDAVVAKIAAEKEGGLEWDSDWRVQYKQASSLRTDVSKGTSTAIGILRSDYELTERTQPSLYWTPQA